MLDMIQECASIVLLLVQISTLSINTFEIPIYNIRGKPLSLLASLEKTQKKICLFANCNALNTLYDVIDSLNNKRNIGERLLNNFNGRPYNILRDLTNDVKPPLAEVQPAFRRLYSAKPNPVYNNLRSLPDWFTPMAAGKTFSVHSPATAKLTPKPEMKLNINTHWNALQQHLTGPIRWSTTALPTLVNNPSNVPHNQLPLKPPTMTAVTDVSQQVIAQSKMSPIEKFTQGLDHFERQFYKESIGLVRHLISTFPSSSDKLTLRHGSRLMLWPGRPEPRFQGGAAAALKLRVERFNGTEATDTIATILNKKVELDSGGAMHDTFDEGDVSSGVAAVFITTLYMRGRWRTSPTVLNGTLPFHDADSAPKRTVRMIRINDIMKYADLKDWDAQVSH
ncbi:hypothetical protein HF086_001182 [Spodoptera exigua]|uniref:Uncharacterized protein n=1 Tax=Spodoptera exigua TaxID=7107 RepID=A0A922SDT5_SPOEX|nr:hypothetical protein HF086_001182 [Spodoptera exigua]